MFTWIKSFFVDESIITNPEAKEPPQKFYKCGRCNDTGIVQFSIKPGGRKMTTFCKCRLSN